MVKHSLSTREDEEDDSQDNGITIESLDQSLMPLPWYRSHSLWSNLMIKTFDETYKCHSNFLDAHPSITTRMRSVLCDWLIEVNDALLNVRKVDLLRSSHYRCAKCIIFIAKATI